MFVWEIFGGNVFKPTKPTRGAPQLTDRLVAWPKVLCFGGSSESTAFSTSSRTFDVDRGAWKEGWNFRWECWRCFWVFSRVFFWEKLGVKVGMFGVVFSRYIQIDTDYNFHSRNQHVAIYSHKLNFMWMIFLWGKFTMEKTTPFCCFVERQPSPRVESDFSKECRSQRSLEILLTMQGATSWAKGWSVALVLRWWILCFFLWKQIWSDLLVFV